MINPGVILRGNLQQLCFDTFRYIQCFNKPGDGVAVDTVMSPGQCFKGFIGFGITFTA